MTTADSVFDAYITRIDAIISSCRKVMLVFFVIAVLLLVIGAWAASRALASLRSYMTRRKAYPTADTLPGAADELAPRVAARAKVSDIADEAESSNLANILATLRAQAMACNNKTSKDDPMDERIFVREFDEYEKS